VNGLSLPALNAGLNTLSFVLLIAGYICIRRRRLVAHRICMLAAFLVSILFLISYVIHHARVGSVPYPGGGFLRAIYFSILIPHVLLAAAIVPLALVTVWRALTGRFDRHIAIARITLPIWLFVSVSGVVIYLMLY